MWPQLGKLRTERPAVATGISFHVQEGMGEPIERYGCLESIGLNSMIQSKTVRPSPVSTATWTTPHAPAVTDVYARNAAQRQLRDSHPAHSFMR